MSEPNEEFVLVPRELITEAEAGLKTFAYGPGASMVSRLLKALAAAPTQTPPGREEALGNILVRFLEWLDVEREVLAWGCPEESHTDTAEKYLALFNAPPQKADGWLPIESAPRDGTKLLGAWKSSRGDRVGVMKFTLSNVWTDEASYAVDPTHWRPLPAPPQKDVT
jgi:hypothetical protein